MKLKKIFKESLLWPVLFSMIYHVLNFLRPYEDVSNLKFIMQKFHYKQAGKSKKRMTTGLKWFSTGRKFIVGATFIFNMLRRNNLVFVDFMSIFNNHEH